jgi:hypothetical protein
VSAKFFQEGDCVDGTWVGTINSTRWVGALSGFATPGRFGGLMSVEFQVNGKLCTSVGNLTGDATNFNATLNWTSTSTTDCPAGAAPATGTLIVKR